MTSSWSAAAQPGMVAALTAAHQGLSTVVVEKAAHYGGSTARSGGGVWIPNNEILQRDGVTDTAEAARTYLHSIIGDVVPAEKIDTYLQRGPEMLSFVLKHSPLKLCWVPNYSDYYPESPGGRAGGRSVEPKPFDAKKLGVDEDGLEPPYGKVPLNMVVMQQDYVRLNQLKRHPRGLLRSLKVGVRSVWANATGKNLVGMGRALIAPLRIGLQKAGVPVLLNTALTDLYVEDGVVRGIYVRDMNAPESAEPQLIRARRGVILGSGGFEHNEQMRVKYQRAPITTEWTVGAASQHRRWHPGGREARRRTGDHGGRLVDPDGATGRRTVDRAVGAQLPRSDHRQHGRKAVHERVDALRRGRSPHVRRRVRSGAGSRREHSLMAGFRPAVPRPLHLRGTATRTTDSEEMDGIRCHRPGRHPRRSWPPRTGLPADGLQPPSSGSTGLRASGVDEDFQRGESAYDRYYGDPTNKPNPNLGEISHPPYYAAKMVPGDSGHQGRCAHRRQRSRAARRRIDHRGSLRRG